MTITKQQFNDLKDGVNNARQLAEAYKGNHENLEFLLFRVGVILEKPGKILESIGGCDGS